MFYMLHPVRISKCTVHMSHWYSTCNMMSVLLMFPVTSHFCDKYFKYWCKLWPPYSVTMIWCHNFRIDMLCKKAAMEETILFVTRQSGYVDMTRQVLMYIKSFILEKEMKGSYNKGQTQKEVWQWMSMLQTYSTDIRMTMTMMRG